MCSGQGADGGRIDARQEKASGSYIKSFLMAPLFSSSNHFHGEFLILMECVICLGCIEVEKTGNHNSSWVVVNYCFTVGSLGEL